MKKIKYSLIIVILQLFSTACLAAELPTNKNPVPISLTLSHYYNEMIKIELSTVIISSIKPVYIEKISINNGRCRTNVKRHQLLPRQLLVGKNIEISLMIGCQVKNIAVSLREGLKQKEWLFLVNSNSVLSQLVRNK